MTTNCRKHSRTDFTSKWDSRSGPNFCMPQGIEESLCSPQRSYSHQKYVAPRDDWTLPRSFLVVCTPHWSGCRIPCGLYSCFWTHRGSGSCILYNRWKAWNRCGSSPREVGACWGSSIQSLLPQRTNSPHGGTSWGGRRGVGVWDCDRERWLIRKRDGPQHFLCANFLRLHLGPDRPVFRAQQSFACQCSSVGESLDKWHSAQKINYQYINKRIPHIYNFKNLKIHF